MNLPAPEILQRLIALHGDLGQSNGADCLDPLLQVLAGNGLSWSDFPELFALCAMSSSQPKRLRRRVGGLHELIGRASTPGERWKARDSLIRRLAALAGQETYRAFSRANGATAIQRAWARRQRQRQRQRRTRTSTCSM
jgi:hypothetical protein